MVATIIIILGEHWNKFAQGQKQQMREGIAAFVSQVKAKLANLFVGHYPQSRHLVVAGSGFYLFLDIVL